MAWLDLEGEIAELFAGDGDAAPRLARHDSSVTTYRTGAQYAKEKKRATVAFHERAREVLGPLVVTCTCGIVLHVHRHGHGGTRRRFCSQACFRRTDLKRLAREADASPLRTDRSRVMVERMARWRAEQAAQKRTTRAA